MALFNVFIVAFQFGLPIAGKLDAQYSEADKLRARTATPHMETEAFGYPLNTLLYGHTRETLSKYKAEPDDVWIASFPKSGTNWVKQIVYMIRLGGDEEAIKKYEDSGEDLSVTIPLPEVVPNFDFDSMKRPRNFFTHLLPGDAPQGGKIIYILRNPENICPSYYKYLSQMNFDGFSFVNHTLDDAAHLMMDGLFMGGHWDQHVKKYFDNPNTLFVKYEDLKRDLLGGVRRIANFVRGEGALTEAQLKTVEEKSTFKYMKQLEARVQGKDWIESIGGKAGDDYTLVSGTKKTEYGPAVVEAWRKWYKEKVMSAFGVDSYEKIKLPGDGGRSEL